MSEWKKVKLSELGEIVGGATPSTKREEYYNGKIPWLTPKDLSGYGSRYISKGERSITQEGLNSCSAKILPKVSVLFTSRAPIGYVAIAENEICTNQGFKSIIPNKNTDPLFLFYLLKHNKQRIEAMGSGTTFKEVSGSVMKNIEVDVPEYAEQKCISAILASIDNLIEQNNLMNKNLEAQAQAIFKSWFVDFEPWGGVMPEDWIVGTLRDICSYSDKRIKKTAFDISNYVSTENMLAEKQGIVNASSLPSVDSATCFEVGNSLISNIRPYFKKIYYCDFKGACSTDVLCFVPKSENLQEYVFFTLFSDSFFEYVMSGSKGTKMPRGDKSQIMQYKVCFSEAQLTLFSKVVKPLLGVISLNRKQSQALATLRDTLLPKLMSGEIDVKEEV